MILEMNLTVGLNVKMTKLFGIVADDFIRTFRRSQRAIGMR